jgi:hypothetical protein
VTFEAYDLGEVRTIDGLVDYGTAKAAWFKDSEGNTYELSEVLSPRWFVTQTALMTPLTSERLQGLLRP